MLTDQIPTVDDHAVPECTSGEVRITVQPIESGAEEAEPVVKGSAQNRMAQENTNIARIISDLNREADGSRIQ